MSTLDQITQLIDRAAEVAGGQNRLARQIEEDPGALANMKKGRRPANWRVRAKLRVVLGEDPLKAFALEIANELADSKNPDEKKAAKGLTAMVEAMPDSRSRER